MDTKETRRIWQSSPPHYEYTSSILSDLDTERPVSLDSLRVLASRESVTEPPQVGGALGVANPGRSDTQGVQQVITQTFACVDTGQMGRRTQGGGRTVAGA